MSIQQEIERQEVELRELLQRVMQAPLEPLAQTVGGLDERMDQVEQLVQDLRDVELAALGQGAEDAKRQMRALRSLAEETPREVQGVMQPVLDSALQGLADRQQRALVAIHQRLQQTLSAQEGGVTAALAALSQGLQEQIQAQTVQASEGVGRLQLNLTQLATAVDNLSAAMTSLRGTQGQLLEQCQNEAALQSGRLGRMQRWLMAAVAVGSVSLAATVAMAAKLLA